MASTADIAPVGPDIWKEAPEKRLITIPPMIAVMSPAAASAPLPTPKASASGSATAATVIPALKSLASLSAL